VEADFSGAMLIDRGDDLLVARAYGLADRRWRIPNELDTRFGLASGTKGLTALAVVSVIEDGALELSTTARSLLGDDLPLIRDDVTVELLLAHRSGIGDYYDEEAITDVDTFELPVPVSRLVTTEDYLAVLDGFPTKFAPDERFAYCNSGYVVLARGSASRPGWSTPSSCDRTSCPAEPRSAMSANRARTSSRFPCAGPATAGSSRLSRT